MTTLPNTLVLLKNYLRVPAKLSHPITGFFIKIMQIIIITFMPVIGKNTECLCKFFTYEAFQYKILPQSLFDSLMRFYLNVIMKE